MKHRVLVPLAHGFEEIEAVTIVDVLRRAGIDVTTVSVGTNPVTGSHNITIEADTRLDEVVVGDFNFMVLPGGMPGSQNLKESEKVISAIQDIYGRDGYVAAICAAPIVLGHAGVLKGKKATCYPGFESSLTGAEIMASPFIADGRVVTGKGPACAIPFALKLVAIIAGPEESANIKDAMQVYWM